MCSRFGEYLCNNCEHRYIERNSVQVCHVCKEAIASGFMHPECKLKSSLDGAVVCCRYNKTVERLVVELKYNFYTDVVNYLITHYLKGLEVLLGPSRFPKLTSRSNLALVPIPLHKTKLRQRGFNQAQLIAQKLEKYSGISSSDVLARNRNTKTQVGMSRAERMANLDNAFEVKGKFDADFGRIKEIILVDDVMTTGTTLEECAAVLKKNEGIKKVYALVFARG